MVAHNEAPHLYITLTYQHLKQKHFHPALYTEPPVFLTNFNGSENVSLMGKRGGS
jgi:hypothetical protein